MSARQGASVTKGLDRAVLLLDVLAHDRQMYWRTIDNGAPPTLPAKQEPDHSLFVR